MKVGRAIKKWRNIKGINQVQLAQKAGITQSYLSLVEQDKKTPTLKTINSICDAFEIPTPVLMLMAIDKEELTPQKREIYEVLYPNIEQLMLSAFSS